MLYTEIVIEYIDVHLKCGYWTFCLWLILKILKLKFFFLIELWMTFVSNLKEDAS